MFIRPIFVCLLFAAFALCACQTAEEAFVGDRLEDLCDESYVVCGVPAGCVLDEDHFIHGSFPGDNRVVVATEDNNVTLEVRLFLSNMQSTGTEFLVQAYEPNCVLDTRVSRERLVDVDIFKKAGDKQTLIFELEAVNKGEHLLEVFSDASVDYALVVEQK